MKTKTPYQRALDVAAAFLEPFSSACERIEIAGSLRRQQPEVGDIEILCIPKIITGESMDLLGQPMRVNLVEERLRYLRVIKGGKKEDKRMVQVDLGTITLDLFIVTRATWGVQLMIRTGSADFSHWMVTHRQQGGALPSHMQVKDGRIWSGGHPLETPEEEDVFRVCGLPWVPPQERAAGRWVR